MSCPHPNGFGSRTGQHIGDRPVKIGRSGNKSDFLFLSDGPYVLIAQLHAVVTARDPNPIQTSS